MVGCGTNHLAARMIWRKVFGRTSILVWGWFGIVWTGWSSICWKHPFRQVVVILLILFFKLSLCKIATSIPSSNSSDDLCFLFCIYPSSIEKQKYECHAWLQAIYMKPCFTLLLRIRSFASMKYYGNGAIQLEIYRTYIPYLISNFTKLS